MAKKSDEQRIREKYEAALKLVAPGSQLREGLSYILQSGTGGLLALDDSKKVERLCEGGVKIDMPFSPTLLYELSKMDGAIVLNDDASRIDAANVFLSPSRSVSSMETGTRHRAAERLAKQAAVAVIAISQKRNSVTLYVGNMKHVLESIPTLLNKASQALQALEKYCNALQEQLEELSIREFQDMVTIFDVCEAIQRAEMIRRIGEEIKPYIMELGTEGRLVDLQLRELIGVYEQGFLVIQDFYKERDSNTAEQVQDTIALLSSTELLTLNNICSALGHGPNMRTVDTYLSSRGYRILTQTHRLSQRNIENLVRAFGSLQEILRAPREQLVAVEGIGEVLAERIRVSLDLLRNQLALEVR
jgi:diadenylate cyclase